MNESGITRVRCEQGWLSVSARDGTRLLAPLIDDNDDESYVTETDSEADESEIDDGEEVLRWLEGVKLDQFYDDFEEAGYDTMDILKELEEYELKELIDDVGMKKGHAKK